jgi:hypothetical protein
MKRKPILALLLLVCLIASNLRVIATPGVRSDSSGVTRVKLAGGGKWFVKFIHMTKLNEENLDYESKWASLTFEIRR